MDPPREPTVLAAMAPPLHLVWYKRDLRTVDHAPLRRALAAGPAVALYAFEPAVLAAPETDRGHLAFIVASLRELRAGLNALGVPLLVVHGDLPALFGRLHAQLPLAAVHAHEETGLEVTYARDRAVARWCRAHGVRFAEVPHFGVVRGLSNRDGWARRWASAMADPPAREPDRQPPPPPALLDELARYAAEHAAPASTPPDAPPAPFGALPEPAALLPDRTDRPGAQPGGRRAGVSLLESFLGERGAGYRRALASPLTAWTGGSRLSPHLAYGTLSLREVHHAVEARRREVAMRRMAGEPGLDRRWEKALESYAKRLRWHCHFIQKLESEPGIEFRNMNRAYDGVRTEDEGAWRPEERARFEAWAAGRTGFPMVDAGMRCLAETGWINFRMRAMLVSFAAYHLWLHWRPVARVLARRFVDFEPGIHISQCQMQSGVTGINALRIYSPSKQAADHDPQGHFIQRWVPELAGIPPDWLPRPEAMSRDLQDRTGCRIGRDYPAPVVDARRAVGDAKARLARVRRSGAARSENLRVYRRHGSRKGGRRRALARRPRETDQLDLGL
jgi:deoxyribodipyrimidine photo-lyase